VALRPFAELFEVMLAQKNLYAELHLQPTASDSEIRTAYRRAALLAHPDKGGSTAAFHSIAFAYEVLSCPASRALYDRAHGEWFRKRRPGVPHAKVPRSASAQQGFTSRLKRKRDGNLGSPAVKRQQASTSPAQGDDLGQPRDDDTSGATNDDVDDTPPAHEKGHETQATLEQLQTALQDLAPVERRAAMAQVPTHIRKELLSYMSCKHASAPPAMPAATESKNNVRRHRGQDGSWSRGTDVRTIHHTHKTSYQAQLRIRHIRMYTRPQADLDTGISYQMALIWARHAIDAAGEDVWNDPCEFCNVFTNALRSAGTSEEDLGLAVFIFMRADEWIGRSATITSPVMPLKDAVTLHSRLLAARQTSWAQLRTEWVPLMRQTQHARRQKLTLAQAEAMAERARMDLLKRRLKQAIHAAERAIDLRQDLEQKMARVQAQLQCKAAKVKAAAAASQKRLARKQQELWAARRRWYCRVDLTMEEILQGPPRDP